MVDSAPVVTMSWRSRAAGLTATSAAVAAVLLCTCIPDGRWPGYVLGIVLIAVLATAHHRTGEIRLSAVQALVLTGFVVGAGLRTDSADVPLIAAAVIIAGLLLNETLFIHSQVQMVANVSVDALSYRPLLPGPVQATVQSALVVLAGVTAATGVTSWPLLVLTLVTAGIAVYGVGRETLRRKGRHRTPKVLRDAMIAHAPEFAVYHSAPPGTEYQLTMWLPYLERIGRPYMIILREKDGLDTIAAATTAPVLVCNAVADVDNVTVPSLRAVFYVNNGMKNVHMVRFQELTHIQLLHGDSDKTSSHNPVTAMFDRIYVAGQAGIDRYAAHGVLIPAEKFEIVGRPQVESIEVAAPAGPTATVMYGTTWAGLYADANYCSLPIGERIVQALLDRGLTVIFRPHQYVYRSRQLRALADRIDAMLAADRAATGRAHVYGPPARALPLAECFNRSDAMISDVSGITADYLYSEKPLAMVDMLGQGEGFRTEFPMAAAAYVLDRKATNLASVLDDLLVRDPLAGLRREIKVRYLGDFPADRYADAFLNAARRELTSSPARVTERV